MSFTRYDSKAAKNENLIHTNVWCFYQGGLSRGCLSEFNSVWSLENMMRNTQYKQLLHTNIQHHLKVYYKGTQSCIIMKTITRSY